MITELLKTEEDIAHVEARIKGTTLDNNAQFIRFWSAKSIQLDGDFTPDELTLIADIMRSMPSAKLTP